MKTYITFLVYFHLQKKRIRGCTRGNLEHLFELRQRWIRRIGNIHVLPRQIYNSMNIKVIMVDLLGGIHPSSKKIAPRALEIILGRVYSFLEKGSGGEFPVDKSGALPTGDKDKKHNLIQQIHPSSKKIPTGTFVVDNSGALPTGDKDNSMISSSRFGGKSDYITLHR